jgi:hypothetical protein
VNRVGGFSNFRPQGKGKGEIQISPAAGQIEGIDLLVVCNDTSGAFLVRCKRLEARLAHALRIALLKAGWKQTALPRAFVAKDDAAVSAVVLAHKPVKWNLALCAEIRLLVGHPTRSH